MSKPRFDTSLFGQPSPHDGEWAWRKEVLAPLGLTLAVVEVLFEGDIFTFSGPGFEQRIGEELLAANLANFEIELQTGQPFHIFYQLHSPRLNEALEFLKARLDALHILPSCRIAFADCATETWVQFYPGTEGESAP